MTAKMHAAYITENSERFLAELAEFCEIQSVTSEGDDGHEAAAWLNQRLGALGADVRIIDLPDAPPIVYAEVGPASAEKSLLIYNHYDVQPPDPLELWYDDPFDPVFRNGQLFARGVADNKAALVARIQAIEAWLRTRGRLPLRIKWIIEGEEELGSPHLSMVSQMYSDLFSDADGCLWESGNKDSEGRQMMYCGLKGIAYFELRTRGAKSDLHSSYGTLVPNPAWRLVWALNTLRDRDERITVDGLMDHVRAPTDAEEAYLREIPFNGDALRAEYEIPRFLHNLDGADALIEHLYAPTCTICGLRSGYTSIGSKTVLPAFAMAKLDFRLVPDLTPERVQNLLRAHLDRRGFEDIEIIMMDGEHPSRSPIDSPVATAARSAVRKVTQKEPVVYPNMAASGPMHQLCDTFDIPVVGFGASWYGSNVHAPNENIRVSDYVEAIEVMGVFMEEFSRA